ncbi:MAG TPA: heme ABC exporter ATP-binding protein CcmA [Mycobacteriales bacterium]|nr:heme ABC exporter ATP-binding protein CcmA [Mycobacteriales bacterium]
MTALAAQGVSVAFGSRRVLRDVSLDVKAGELVVLQGPSGSGKSCLLAVCAGLQAPDTGTVTLDDEPVRLRDAAQRRRVGLLLQGLGLLPLLTATENVEIPLQVADDALAPATVVDRAATALARVELADRADRLVEELSGGQRQRVALARALVARPEVVLVDEPTSALDGQLRDLVFRLLREEAERGAAVLVATHDPAVIGWSDRLLLLHDGELTEG